MSETSTTPGRRIDALPTDEPNQYPFPRLNPGDYGKDVDGLWCCCPPQPLREDRFEYFYGCLAKHKVVEHEDGSITVSPSILITKHNAGVVTTWHGFLEHGRWREC